METPTSTGQHVIELEDVADPPPELRGQRVVVRWRCSCGKSGPALVDRDRAQTGGERHVDAVARGLAFDGSVDPSGA